MTQAPPTVFHYGTTAERAEHLMCAAFRAIAAGWPAVYFKPGSLAGSIPVIDLDAMVRDAGALAVEMQRETRRRLSINGGN